MSTAIYYFTGTGNSLKIAKDISRGIPDSKLQHIAEAVESNGIVEESSEKIGIVFPVYVSGLPLIVEKFVRVLKPSKGCYIFAIANYGASAGGSLLQIDDLLREKGQRLSAAFGMKMPDNTQILFPPSPEREQKQDFAREESEAESIAGIVAQGIEAGVDLISSARRTFGASWRRSQFDPALMGRNFTADGKCDGCSVCEQICPVHNIDIETARPRWLDRCEQCLACMQWCPRSAIQFSSSTATWGRYHHPDIDISELMRRWNA